jgi:hypothetical protein
VARGERAVASPFVQFMASTAGRVTRGVVGIALIAVGPILGGIGGWVVGAVGAVLVLAGVFDFCVISGAIANVWSGREVRARGTRGATRVA